ncbi:hypothetical protein BGAL_0505g00070 [Botrytis galanthina]|uniref:Ketoreductase domain-containing protein n=1 Tax=Botrytis galanthina TaxID=278940 RepID=A0A4S8QKB0_9HELO|nr:hypothetical protein BGAL_0505g00070 [Botrytis galanthina]
MASPRKIDNLPIIAQRALDMQVLCLGLSRTSTMSLQESLNKLGYKTYHCRVAAPTKVHIPLWLEGFDAKLSGNGKPFGREEFDKILTNFSATTDMPAVNFSEGLLAAYPAAKVILTTRDPDKWIESVERSIYAIVNSHIWPLLKIILPALRAGFIAHNEKIRRLAGGRLLEFSPKDGWEPLCNFLGKPVPNEPYPHSEAGKTFVPPVPDLLSVEKKVLIQLSLSRLLASPQDQKTFVGSPSLTKYLDWAQHYLDTNKNQLDLSAYNESMFHTFCNEIESNDPEGELLVRGVKNLKCIFEGNVQALEVLFRDNLTASYYQFSNQVTPAFSQGMVYLDLLAHNQSNIKILEIGAGTGSTTESVLQELMFCEDISGERFHEPRFVDYTFTDISPRFFEPARERLREYTDRMIFLTLDIERRLQEQGFRSSEYDLIIASNVLHATASLTDVLHNIHTMLEPDRRLVLCKASPTNIESAYFDPNSTYVTAGGLGGLDRNIALWMANRGARSLILLSRTQRQNHSDAAKSVLARLAEQGVQVATPACDISDFEQLRTSLEVCKYMPPIRGCIQGSMVLCDSTFANMALDAFNAAVKPKVDGTWNLHRTLPNGMDFFIMLASIAGVMGIHGQANYACGNTYQDEFARYRCQLGEKAVSLDLGIVSNVGWVAEQKMISRASNTLEDLPAIRVSESELYAVLDYYCDPSLPVQTGSPSQTWVGQVQIKQRRSGLADPYWMQLPIARSLRQRGTHNVSNSNDESSVDYKFLITEANSQAKVTDIIISGLQSKLSRTLAMEEEDIDAEKIHWC